MITPLGILHDALVLGLLSYVWLHPDSAAAQWIIIGLLAVATCKTLRWLRRRRDNDRCRRHEAAWKVTQAAKLEEFENATNFRRTKEEAAALIRDAAHPNELRKRLEEGILRVPASVAGEPGFGEDAAAVARSAKVFDEQLAAFLVRKAPDALTENENLPSFLVERLVWHYASRYPSFGCGWAVNMGRQATSRPRLKALIARYGLTASHDVAQKLFCHAVGYSDPPSELELSAHSGPHKRIHSVQILRAFPDWPADWEPRVSPVERKASDDRAQAANVSHSGVAVVLGAIVGVPVLVALCVWMAACEAFDDIAWPFRS